MPNQLDSNGLQVKTVPEVVADLEAKFRTIYGADINLDQNSPDGQLINIIAQAIVDNLELLASTNSNFDPDQAYGTILDQRVAINGIARRAGTYTIQPVSVTVDRAMTLVGLDGAVTPSGSEFVVSDDAGNQFILETTQVISAAGTASYNFRAKDVGRVLTSPNTITNVITVTLGVTAVNNPAVATSFGVDEETDTELKLRRSMMFSLPAVGPADAVRAAILAVSGVTACTVVENNTTGTVGSVPAHSIWCIVEGGTDASVAAAIYAKKSAGCGMYGATTVVVDRPNSQTVDIKFSRPTNQDLYIEFTLTARRSGVTFDTDYIKEQLVAALVYQMGQQATAEEVIAQLRTIVPDGIATAVGVSDDGLTYVEILDPTGDNYKFVASVANISVTV